MNVLRCTTCSKILGSTEGPFVCRGCEDFAGDRSESRYFAAVDVREAAERSDVEGAECVFCPALTRSDDGLCSSCRDGWGMSERNHPSNPRWVPNRDTNWGQPA